MSAPNTGKCARLEQRRIARAADERPAGRPRAAPARARARAAAPTSRREHDDEIGMRRSSSVSSPSRACDRRRRVRARLARERATTAPDSAQPPCGIEVAVDVRAAAPRGESRRDRVGVEALERVTAAREQRRSCRARSRRASARATGTSRRSRGTAADCAFHAASLRALARRARVVLVGAVVDAHDLADVGRLGERVGPRPGVDQRDVAWPRARSASAAVTPKMPPPTTTTRTSVALAARLREVPRERGHLARPGVLDLARRRRCRSSSCRSSNVGVPTDSR